MEMTRQGLCVLHTNYEGENNAYDYLVNRYTKHDPTLPHIYLKCPSDVCETNKEGPQVTDAIYLRYDHNVMKHIYICTKCNYKWKTDSR